MWRQNYLLTGQQGVARGNRLVVKDVKAGPAQLARTEGVLEWDVERTQRELAAVRTVIGPPWQTDHKQAALAALGVLTLDREVDKA